jgi:hypothetical protein
MQTSFWKRAASCAVLAAVASACQSGGGGGFEPLVIDLSQHKATATPAPTPTPTPAAAALRTAPAPAATPIPPPATSTGPAATPEPGGPTLEPAEVVDAQLKAFNRHDLEAFLATFAPNATLSDQPEPVRASGLTELRRVYGPGFADNPSIKISVSSRIVLGRYVVDSEAASGLPDGSSVAEIVIYEVEAGKIAKVWVIR